MAAPRTDRDNADLFESGGLCRPAHAYVIGAWYGDLRDIANTGWWNTISSPGFLSPNYLKRRTCSVKISRIHSDSRLIIRTVDAPRLTLRGELLVVRPTPENFLGFRTATTQLRAALTEGIEWSRHLRTLDPGDDDADQIVMTLGLEIVGAGWFLQLRVGGQHNPAIYYAPAQSLPAEDSARRLAARQPPTP